MKTTFSIEIRLSTSCKHCDYEASGSAWKYVYMRMLWHLKFRCPGRNKPEVLSRELPFFKSMWDLWRLPS